MSKIPWLADAETMTGRIGRSGGLVRGCPGPRGDGVRCTYCFGVPLRRRFGYDLSPGHAVLDRERLAAVGRLRKPSLIFVASMGDPEWLRDIRDYRELCDTMVVNQQHHFIMLTKRFMENTPRLPSNVWWGPSIDGVDKPHNLALLRMLAEHEPADRRVVSIEPLLDWNSELQDALIAANPAWVIVGPLDGGRRIKPRGEWIDSIVRAIEERNIPVYEKPGLGYWRAPHCRVCHYPQAMRLT